METGWRREASPQHPQIRSAMVRIPAQDAQIGMPPALPEHLNHVAEQLNTTFGLDVVFEPDMQTEIFFALSAVRGRYAQERGRPDVADVVARLRKLKAALDQATGILSALQPGFSRADDKTRVAVGTLIELLAINPEVGSPAKAHDTVATFLKLSNYLAEACAINVEELRRIRGEPGRPQYDWYDEFTDLLWAIAHHFGIKPTIETDRITGERKGPFLMLALLMEGFLLPEMRSSGPVTCAKRLERSLRRLRRQRQKPPS